MTSCTVLSELLDWMRSVATERIQSAEGLLGSCSPSAVPGTRQGGGARMPATKRTRQRSHAAVQNAVTAEDQLRPIYAVKADLFRVLGHPVRVRIIELLRDGERSVGSLQGSLGLDSSGTSQHLTVLRTQGLVTSRRQGTTVYYRVADDAIFGLLDAARILIKHILGRQQAALTDLAHSLSGDAA